MIELTYYYTKQKVMINNLHIETAFTNTEGKTFLEMKNKRSMEVIEDLPTIKTLILDWERQKLYRPSAL